MTEFQDTDPGHPQPVSEMARNFIEAIPHARALNLQIEEIGNGIAVIRMPYAAHLVGDPRTGVIHGGAVSALMDTCCGAAVLSHPDNGAPTATIDLRIDYMRPARPGATITTRAECYQVTRSVAFVRATAHDDDLSAPVAMATGAFTAQGSRSKDDQA